MAAIGTIHETVTQGSTFVGLPVPTMQTSHSVRKSKLIWKQKSHSLQTITMYEGTPIPSSSSTLRSYLVAEIITTRDGVVVRSGEVDEDGYGCTFKDAYTDFLTSIYERYSSLSKRKERLSYQDQLIYQNLRRLLK